MSACDIDVRSDFTVRTENPLQVICEKLEHLLNEAVEDQEEQIAKIRQAIVKLRALEKQPIHPWHIYLDLPERLLWNWLLDHLEGALDGLEGHLNDLQDTIQDVGGQVRAVLEGVGNPGALRDIAVLMSEGIAQRATALAKEVSLTKLAVDNEWSSAAADAYSERAQQQVDEGLNQVTSAAQALADFLDGHAETEMDFWDSMGDLVINVCLFMAGLVLTLIGLAAMIVGAAAALPTAGVSLLVTVLGWVSAIGGLLIAVISGWLLLKSLKDSISDADNALGSGVDTMTAGAVPAGYAWPMLAS